MNVTGYGPTSLLDPWNTQDPAAYPPAPCRTIEITDAIRAEDEARRVERQRSLAAMRFSAPPPQPAKPVVQLRCGWCEQPVNRDIIDAHKRVCPQRPGKKASRELAETWVDTQNKVYEYDAEVVEPIALKLLDAAAGSLGVTPVAPAAAPAPEPEVSEEEAALNAVWHSLSLDDKRFVLADALERNA